MKNANKEQVPNKWKSGDEINSFDLKNEFKPNKFGFIGKTFLYFLITTSCLLLCMSSTISSKGNGYLVPIIIQNYSDQSIKGFGYLGESLDTFLESTNLKIFPTLKSPLQTKNEILGFMNKKESFGNNQTVLFLLESRALPSKNGDILILPSDYGSNYNINDIFLSDLLCQCMEFPGKNKVVLIDIMRPWSSISHGGLFWDLGADADKVLEIAKIKYIKRNGFSPDKLNFWTWWAAGKGEFSRTIGSGNSFFRDQLSKALENFNNTKLNRLKGLESFKNLSETVRKNVNVQSNFFMGSNQNPFLIGWGKDPLLLPSHFSNNVLSKNEKFYWPKEYLASWESYFSLVNNQGFLKNPRIMCDILSSLVRFQYLWIISKLEPKILDNFKNEITVHFNEMEIFKNKILKTGKPLSMDLYQERFPNFFVKKLELQKKVEKIISKSPEATPKQEEEAFKIGLGALTKDDPYFLEITIKNILLDTDNLTYFEIQKASEIIKNHHQEFLFPESLIYERIIKSYKRNPLKINSKIIKAALTANTIGFSALSHEIKNENLYNANLIGMQNLFQADWLLEFSENVTNTEIEDLYGVSEKINLQVLNACENLESALEIFEKTLVELSVLVNGNFINPEWVLALLEPLELNGKILGLEEDIIDQGIFLDVKNKSLIEIETSLNDFIKNISKAKSSLLFKRKNLISFLNETVLSKLNNSSNDFQDTRKIISEGYHIGVFCFDDLNAVNLVLNGITNNLNQVFSGSISYGNNDKIESMYGETIASSKNKQELELINTRKGILDVQASLLKSIGLISESIKLKNKIPQNDSNSRNDDWVNLVSFLPKLYFTDIPNTVKKSSLRIQERYDLVESKKLTESSIDDNSIRLKRTNNRLKKHFSRVEQIMIQRNQAEIDSEWWLERIKEIRQQSIPIQQNSFPLQEGFTSPVILGKNSKTFERSISFYVPSSKEDPPTLRSFHDDQSLFTAEMKVFNPEYLSINQNIWKITANIRFSLINENIPFPGLKSFLPIGVTGNGFTNLFQLPVVIESSKPELELIIRKNSQDGVKVGDLYNLRPGAEGEKLYFSAINNSPKPKKSIIKSYHPKSGQIISETSLQLSPGKETPVILNIDRKYERANVGNVYEIISDEKIEFEIFDQENPTQSRHKRIVSFHLKDPRDFVLVDSTQYVPASFPKNKNSSLFFNLKSRIRDLNPQPKVEMVFDKSRNPMMLTEGTGNKTQSLIPDAIVQLSSNGINFSPFEPFTGEVFLNIDGIKRMYRYGFKPYPYGDPFALVLKTDTYIGMSDIKVSSDFKTLEFNLEADILNSKAKLETGLWDLNNDPIEPINSLKSDISCSFNTPRREFVKLIQEKDSPFLKIYGYIDDWSIRWNVEGISGAKIIHAWLKDENENIICRKSVKTIIDRTPPDKLEIDGFPPVVSPGQEINIRIITTDNESDISKVELFFAQKIEGKNNNELPVLKLNRSKEIPSLWEGKYLVPKDSNGPQIFTFVSTNGFGISKRINSNWEVVPVKIPTSGDIVASIIEGGRKQPSLTVKLFDMKGKLVRTQISNDEGVAKFNNLQPGTYKVFVEKISSGRSSTQSVNLKVGDVAKTSLELLQ